MQLENFTLLRNNSKKSITSLLDDKNDRNKILANVVKEDDGVIGIYQVVELVWISAFSNIWRQPCPLDNMIQVMGRLDREKCGPICNVEFFDEETTAIYITRGTVCPKNT